MSTNSFDARGDAVGRRPRATRSSGSTRSSRRFDVARLPFSLKILLENLLRHEDGETVRADDIEALARWDANAEPSREIAFTPARVLMQDFTGVPAVVDLAAMRDAMAALGGDPAKINPLVPVELVIDHSVQVDEFGTRDAFDANAELEFERNRERYAFLRWGQDAFENFQVVPPDTGIVPPGQPRVPGARGVRRRRDAARPTPTRSSAPTRTRRWSTASACSAGASAGSRPRRRCSASRCRC